MIIVLDQERIYNDLVRDMPKFVKVVWQPKSGGQKYHEIVFCSICCGILMHSSVRFFFTISSVNSMLINCDFVEKKSARFFCVDVMAIKIKAKFLLI